MDTESILKRHAHYILLAMGFIGPLLSMWVPSTSELTSPRFLMSYSWALMTLLVGCWLSYRRLIPTPLWCPVILLVFCAVALPLMKVYFTE